MVFRVVVMALVLLCGLPEATQAANVVRRGALVCVYMCAYAHLYAYIFTHTHVFLPSLLTSPIAPTAPTSYCPLHFLPTQLSDILGGHLFESVAEHVSHVRASFNASEYPFTPLHMNPRYECVCVYEYVCVRGYIYVMYLYTLSLSPTHTHTHTHAHAHAHAHIGRTSCSSSAFKRPRARATQTT
jgi:hypothetical protein